jgi:hypothetical protein
MDVPSPHGRSASCCWCSDKEEGVMFEKLKDEMSPEKRISKAAALIVMVCMSPACVVLFATLMFHALAPESWWWISGGQAILCAFMMVISGFLSCVTAAAYFDND